MELKSNQTKLKKKGMCGNEFNGIGYHCIVRLIIRGMCSCIDYLQNKTQYDKTSIGALSDPYKYRNTHTYCCTSNVSPYPIAHPPTERS